MLEEEREDGEIIPPIGNMGRRRAVEPGVLVLVGEEEGVHDERRDEREERGERRSGRGLYNRTRASVLWPSGLNGKRNQNTENTRQNFKQATGPRFPRLAVAISNISLD